jgi:hypothetical protein
MSRDYYVFFCNPEYLETPSDEERVDPQTIPAIF